MCGDRLFRIDKRIKFFQDLAAAQPHGADLGDAFRRRAESRCFEVKNDIFPVNGTVRRPLDNRHTVVDIIGFHAVQNFDILALFAQLFHRFQRIGKRLCHAVVGDGDRLVSPCSGARNQVGGLRNAVHHGHLRVQMQLNALFGRIVLPLEFRHGGNSARTQDVTLLIGVIIICTRHQHAAALRQRFERRQLVRIPLFVEPGAYGDRIGLIGHVEAHAALAAVSAVPHFAYGEDLAPHRDAAAVRLQLMQRQRHFADRPAVQHGGTAQINGQSLCRTGRHARRARG